MQSINRNIQELRELIYSLNLVLNQAILKLKKLEKKPPIVQQYLGGGSKTTSFKELVDTIADAQNPNALLLDGSRKFSGDAKIGWTDYPAIEISPYLMYGIAGRDSLLIKCANELKIQADLYSAGQARFGSFFEMTGVAAALARFLTCGNPSNTFEHLNTGATYDTIMKFNKGAVGACNVEILQAGDITMLANKVLSGLGDVRTPSLPVADPSDGLSKLWKDAGGFVKVGT